MEYEEVRQLKQSDKSTVTLVREKSGDALRIRKVLKGRHDIYSELQKYSHPGLPKLYEVEISAAATTVVEEYIEGASIGTAELTEKQLYGAMRELCHVLGFLHAKGIVHRDIKPSNIILAKDGHVRLIDFDAARRHRENSESDTRLLGTRGYAPPEQYGFAQTDARTDIYALGVTLRQLLPEEPAGSKYRKFIKKCTDLNPDKRYQSIRAVERALFFARHALPVRCGMAAAAVFLTVCILQAVTHGPKGPAYGETEYKTHDEPEYPTEELLFYVKGGEYIKQVSDEEHADEFVSMRVDMTGQEDYVDFAIPYSLNNWIEFGERYDLGYNLGELADDTQATFWYNGVEISLWGTEVQDFLNRIPLYGYLDFGDVPLMTQITCVDADGDGTRELFVSKGNREHALVTTAWRLSDAEKKEFEYVGVMWGTTTMYLYDNGDMRAIVNDSELNRYHYEGGVLTDISVVDYSEFKAKQREEAEKRWSEEAASKEAEILASREEDASSKEAKEQSGEAESESEGLVWDERTIQEIQNLENTMHQYDEFFPRKD